MKNILLSILISFLMVVFALNVPANWFSITKYFNNDLGASITNLTGAELLSNFPAVYNTNLNALNANKFDIASTSHTNLVTASSLASIGTITTGVWNATPIPVLYNGTGTTSPSLYRTMIGDSTNGFTVASTTGTSGQFWTSGGAGAYPAWTTAAIDESGAFNWTGLHTWSIGATFNGVVDIEADSAANLTLNTVSYQFPSADGNSNDILSTNGAGVLTWNPSSELATSTHTGVSVFSSTASTTVFTFTVPANTLGTNGVIKIIMPLSDIKVGASGDVIFAELNYGGSKQNLSIINGTASDNEFSGEMIVTLIASNSTGAQESTIYIEGEKPGITLNSVGTDASMNFVDTVTHSVDSTSAQTFSLILRNSASEAATGFTIDNVIGEYIK